MHPPTPRQALLPLRAPALVVFCALLGVGCASSSMKFHFAAVDTKERVLEFYRVRIEARAGNSRSKLQTGYYDADALHQLYGQVDKAGTGRRQDGTPVGQVIVEFDPATGRFRIIDQRERFTVVYGTNADAVAQQISAFASAQDTGQMLGGLMAAAFGHSEFAALYAARAAAEEKTKAAEQLKADLEKVAAETGDLRTEAGLLVHVKERVRRALQAATSRSDSGVILDDDFAKALAEAKAVQSAGKADAR